MKGSRFYGQLAFEGGEGARRMLARRANICGVNPSERRDKRPVSGGSVNAEMEEARHAAQASTEKRSVPDRPGQYLKKTGTKTAKKRRANTTSRTLPSTGERGLKNQRGGIIGGGWGPSPARPHSTTAEKATQENDSPDQLGLSGGQPYGCHFWEVRAIYLRIHLLRQGKATTRLGGKVKGVTKLTCAGGRIPHHRRHRKERREEEESTGSTVLKKKNVPRDVDALGDT